MRILISSMLIIGLVSFGFQARAQEKNAPCGIEPGAECPHPMDAPGDFEGGTGPFESALHSKIKELRNVILKNNLKLSDEKIKKVEAITKKYDKEEKKLFKKIQVAQLKMQILFLEEKSTDTEYRALIEEIKNAHKELFKTHEKKFDELSKVLTPVEQAKFLFFVDKARNHFWNKLNQGWNQPDQETQETPPEETQKQNQ